MFLKSEILPQQSTSFITLASEFDFVADDLSVSQPVSESVKNQTELSPDALSESDAPSQLEPLSESDLQEVAQAKVTAQQNIAEAIDSMDFQMN